VSAGGRQEIYLIFEFGEVESTFYLFTDGPDWNGSDRCVSSPTISASLSTAAGLRLGMPRSQLEAILGKPDAVLDGRLVYSRELNERTTPKEFEKLRKEYPQQLSDKAAHEKFDVQTVEIYIEARFANSKLAYLAVSTTG
jgi:hypothetical protein